ncbi:MAG: hypothetical protein K8W52_43865 [Deltaproteobacteria bacterium]|nr:hypothetical protein [Deltaproteobacteria bacterium]
MRSPALAAALCAVAACSSPSRPASGSATTVTAAPAIDAPLAATPAPGKVGEVCHLDPASPQGTCHAGLFCFPSGGEMGACTVPCGVTGLAPGGVCPDEAVCVATGRAGELCAARCETGADCLLPGTACDPARHVCLPPDMATPALARCDAPARPRGDFSPPVALSSATSPGVYQYEPAATLTASGDLVVLYTGGGMFMGPSALGIARVPRAGAPVLDATIKTTKSQHFDPWLATDPSGALHAVWLGHNGGGRDLDPEIGYVRSTDGGATWTAPVAVDAPEDCADHRPFCLDKPMVAAGVGSGGKGAAVRIFYSSNGMRMRSSTDGGKTFGAAVSVVGATYGDVAIDRGGAIHVVASSEQEEEAADGDEAARASVWGTNQAAIVYTASTDGVHFAAPVAVSAPAESTPFFFVNPTLAIDEKRGWIYVAYAAGTPDGAWDIQLATSKDRGKTWTRIKANDDATCANHMVPNLAIDPTRGEPLLTWYENRGDAGHVAFTTCAVGGGSCKPAVAISAPMAAYDLVRHSSKWLGEYEALLVDAKTRTLHAAWTEVGDEGGAPIARIKTATRALPR